MDVGNGARQDSDMFKTELQVRPIRGSDDRVLLSQLVYESKNYYYVVPEGFVTNYASIPKCIRWYIDQDEPYIRDASVLHDYLYTGASVSRADADKIFLEAMLEAGAPKRKAYVAYFAVRLFGGGNYGG